jgi:hypothetical protein
LCAGSSPLYHKGTEQNANLDADSSIHVPILSDSSFFDQIFEKKGVPFLVKSMPFQSSPCHLPSPLCHRSSALLQPEAPGGYPFTPPLYQGRGTLVCPIRWVCCFAEYIYAGASASPCSSHVFCHLHPWICTCHSFICPCCCRWETCSNALGPRTPLGLVWFKCWKCQKGQAGRSICSTAE